MIPSFLANYIKNRPFWYVKPPLLASVSPTIPLFLTTIVVKTVVRIFRHVLLHSFVFTIHDPTFLDPILSITPSSVSSFINICTDLREILITEASSSCVTDGFSRRNSNRYSRSDSVPTSFCALFCAIKYA